MRRTNGSCYGEKQILQNQISESNKFFGGANRLSNPSEGHFIYYFSSYFLGNNKNIHYICTVVIEVLLGRWAILSYKKDVFERLSLCSTNLANSKPQQTDDNRSVTWCVSIFHIIELVLAWANCVVYPVWRGNARACRARMGRETDTYAFFVS